MDNYEDIINLPHHVSRTHAPMSLENRAAQFAPFAALSGHDDAIAETARLTSGRIGLSADERQRLSAGLIRACESGHPVTITYFEKDPLKSGGRYLSVRDSVRHIDEIEKSVTLASSRLVIPLADISDISDT